MVEQKPTFLGGIGTKEKGEMQYPSSEGQGYERVEFKRPGEYSTVPAIDGMKRREVPAFLKKVFKESLKPVYDGASDLPATMGHYCTEVERVGKEKGELVDSKTLTKLKNLAKEAHINRGDKVKIKSVYDQAEEVLAGLRCEKIKRR